MKTQVIIVERRQHPREGVLAEIENITYRVLRKYGIDGTTAHPSPSMAKNAA